MYPKVFIGDIFSSKAKTLVNTVNCVGVMGKGIASEFKKRFPGMYAQYKEDCNYGRVKIGNVSLYRELFGVSIINFPTKIHWKSPSLLKDIEKGLDDFLTKYKSWGIESVAFPPLGCGNGGLSWDDVGPLMYGKLKNLNISVEIYAPFGTNQEKLQPSFLNSPGDKKKYMGQRLKNFTNIGSLAALEVLSRLQKQKYAKPIGRTMFQKICYVLTELSVDTGLSFSQSSYGPFSADLKQVVHSFANQNLLSEKQVNKMMVQSVGDGFNVIKENYLEDFNKIEPQITKTVDLFCRIKDTEQAEEVTTILYTFGQLIKRKEKVTKKDIVLYVLKWKERWNDEVKLESINGSIQSLNALGWINLAN